LGKSLLPFSSDSLVFQSHPWKCKGKVVPVHQLSTTTLWRRIGGVNVQLHSSFDLGTRWRWYVKNTEVEWIHLAHDMDQWRSPVNTVMNLWVPWKAANLTS
jgi:hypothetical protein